METFKINENIKNSLPKESNIWYTKAKLIIKIIEKIVLTLTIAISIGFPIKCIINYELISNTYDGKSYFLIIMITSIILGMGLTCWFIIKTTNNRMKNFGYLGRFNENIEINNNILTYNYWYNNEENTYKIKINTIEKLEYNRENRLLKITADIAENNEQYKKDELKICDFYTPSLYEKLNEIK